MTMHVDLPSSSAGFRPLDRAVLLHLGDVLRESLAEEAGAEFPNTLQALLDRWPRTGIRTAAERAHFEREVLTAMPALKSFAMTLTGRVDKADDLVQESVCRALKFAHRFEPGTKTTAWLITILRNLFLSEYRRRRREIDDPDGLHASRLAAPPEQQGRADLTDFLLAFGTLTRDQREALTLVGVQGYSYDEAAEMAGVALGTMKSRVNRGRVRLAEILALDDDEPDHVMRAALGASRS